MLRGDLRKHLPIGFHVQDWSVGANSDSCADVFTTRTLHFSIPRAHLEDIKICQQKLARRKESSRQKCFLLGTHVLAGRWGSNSLNNGGNLENNDSALLMKSRRSSRSRRCQGTNSRRGKLTVSVDILILNSTLVQELLCFLHSFHLASLPSSKLFPALLRRAFASSSFITSTCYRTHLPHIQKLVRHRPHS